MTFSYKCPIYAGGTKGIGRACAEELASLGAKVGLEVSSISALDLSFKLFQIWFLICDLWVQGPRIFHLKIIGSVEALELTARL